MLKFASADDVPRAYAFGPFQFDSHERALFRDGVAVPLPPKAAELLALFLRSSGRLLPKEVLIASLWGDAAIEESSLTQAIFLLRKALGNDDRYIENVPRRGYRFVAAVAHADALAATHNSLPARPRYLRPLALVAIVLAVAGTVGFTLRRTTTIDAREAIPAEIAPQAREAYLKGRHHWNRRTTADFHKAVDYFRAATEREPQFALAWAGLADTYNFLGQAPRAKIAAQRALDADGRNAQAYAALGNAALFHDFDWPAADHALARAVDLAPSYATAHHWRAYLLVSQRRFAEALAAIERARELDPLSAIIATDLGAIHYYSGDHDKAVAELRRALELDPSFTQAHALLVMAYLAKGDVDRAAAELPLTNHGVLEEITILCARGQPEHALTILSELEKRDSDTRGLSNYSMAVGFSAAADHTRALTWLARAYQSRDGDLALLHVDPRLDAIRHDPAFVRFVRTSGLAMAR